MEFFCPKISKQRKKMDDFDLPDLSKIDDPDEYFKQLKRIDNAGGLVWHRTIINMEKTQMEAMDSSQLALFNKLNDMMAMPILRIFYYQNHTENARFCSMIRRTPSFCLDFTCNNHHGCIVCKDKMHSAITMFCDVTYTQCDIIKSILEETKKYEEYFYTLDDVRQYINK